MHEPLDLVGKSPIGMYYNRVMRTLKGWTLEHGDW